MNPIVATRYRTTTTITYTNHAPMEISHKERIEDSDLLQVKAQALREAKALLQHAPLFGTVKKVSVVVEKFALFHSPVMIEGHPTYAVNCGAVAHMLIA